MLDASHIRRNAALHFLHENCIDQTITVTVLLKWFHDDTRKKINDFLGEGTFEEGRKI